MVKYIPTNLSYNFRIRYAIPNIITTCLPPFIKEKMVGRSIENLCCRTEEWHIEIFWNNFEVACTISHPSEKARLFSAWYSDVCPAFYFMSQHIVLRLQGNIPFSVIVFINILEKGNIDHKVGSGSSFVC